MSAKAVFVGMPGAGKSKVGRLVAEALGCDFRDSDDLIVQAEGRSVASIFSDDGETRFREIEAEVVSRALLDFDGVLSLGGGAILAESTRKALRGHPVVLIDVDDAELVRRAKQSSVVRPLLAGDPAAKMAELRSERDAWYREAARHTVTSDDGPVQRVVAEVLRLLGADSEPRP